ncbi:extracellular solute-binding protein family 1 [Paenibacillus curdlanolyticus YK9]|uniref:Extracellular solute-binding protein family 1 n=1 Tax=Paenibacillus curdlanolyticus YK9 TaxID=717606 RepID=E0I3D7_9BACL|nr:extracellular solute-binding protein [Paenibacillus curdlanolyticus]EFM12801.1 extracellular solute-binding protein family 1 [Paenibacillus curdlanolyticus YK9]
MYRKSSMLLLIVSVVAVIIVLLSLLRLPVGPTPDSKAGGKQAVLPPSGEKASEPQTITVSVSLPKDQFQDLEKSAERFMEQNPSITVELSNIEQNDAYDQWKKDGQLGNGPDAALMDNAWVREFAVLGYLKPLDAMMSSMTDAWLDGLADAVNWNGYWWGIPKDADPLVSVWSLPLLDTLTSKGVPGNWGSFVQLAVSAGTSAPKVPIVHWEDDQSEQMLVWLDSFATDGQKAEQLKPFDEGMLKRLDFLAKGDGTAFTISRSHDSKLADKLADGKLLSAVMRWSDYEHLSPELQSLIGVGYPHGWYGGRSFVVFAHSEGKEEALKRWMHHMASEPEQQATFDQYGLLPVIKPIYTQFQGQQQDLEGSRRGSKLWLDDLSLKPSQTPDPAWPRRLERWQELWEGSDGAGDWLERLVQQWRVLEPEGNLSDGEQANRNHTENSSAISS